MKHIARILVLVVLLALTVSTAAYRMDPETSPELAADGAGETFSLADALADAAAGLGQSISDAAGSLSGSLADAAAGTAMSAVADVERTGQYTPDGQELLDVSLSSGAVPLIRSALSEQTGGMVTTAELVAQLNTVENVSAVQNEDGSVTLEVPEGVYAEYEDMIAAAISGG